jgi:cell division septation protein DedD
MRTLFDTDEEEMEAKASEITLSTASLLGIFFGLVLVCGVFFGFGYSMGRGTGAAQATLVPRSSAVNTGETDEAAVTTPPAPRPAIPQPAIPQPAIPQPAMKDQDDTEAPAKAPTRVAETPKEDSSQTLKVAAPFAAQTPAQLVTSKPPAGKVAPVYQAPADAPSATTGQPMVQIAAVSRSQDADVLVAALRQRGYGVVVRSEPQDHLLHVQVGPFANRMQAAEIKQKLLSDGYNAIIKQ